jgi:hypothetical protein
MLSASISILLIAASAWAGTLRDNFDDGDMKGWDLSGAGDAWEIKNGELVIPPAGAPPQFLIGEADWEDYTIRVSAKIVKHQTTDFLEGPNIMARWESPLHLYIFAFGSSGVNDKTAYAFYVAGDIEAKHLEVKPFEWELDKWYDLRLVAEGDRFRFYVNDQLVIDYTDDVYPKGKVGITSAFIGTTVHFDDLSVTGDEVPDMNLSQVSVLPNKGKLVTKWAKLKAKR